MRYKEIVEYTDKQTLIDLKRQLTADGYRIIGKGRDALVFSKKDDPEVVKFFIGTEGYWSPNDAAAGFLAFAKFCKDYPTRHLPRFGSITKRTFGNEDLYHVNMEKLHRLNDNEYLVAKSMVDAVRDNLAYEDAINMIKNYGSKALPKYQKQVEKERTSALKIAEQNKELFTVIEKLHHTSKSEDISLDLFNGTADNIMKRKDGTIVVVDPFAL